MNDAVSAVLTDTEKDLWTDSWRLDGDALRLDTDLPWSVEKTTLRGGLQDGLDLLTVDNGEFSFDILPSRGMGIWKGTYLGVRLGWDSPVRDPVNPAFVDLNDRGGLGWLKGFNE